MGCTFEMNGYANFQKIGQDIAKLLVANGFALKYPNPNLGGTINDTTTKFTLETTDLVDPLSTATNTESTAQPWRIHIDCSDDVTTTDPGTLRIFAATKHQLNDDGDVTWEYQGQGSDGFWKRRSGELTGGFYKGTDRLLNIVALPFASKHWGNTMVYDEEMRNTGATIPGSTSSSGTLEVPDTSYGFKGSSIEAHPLSFRLSISDHGIALVVWEEGQDLWGNRFSWFVIQRPVNSETGRPLVVQDINSRCPVFCVYSVGGGEPDVTVTNIFSETFNVSADPYLNTLYSKAAKIYRFTVREFDVNRPTIPVFASIDTPDAKAVLNAKEQVSITEGNQYVINFMKGFNTARYMYNEELDLITYTSGDVISQYTDISIQPYKNPNNNNAPITVKYKAMHTNLPNNRGMRILIAVDGQGVSGNCAGI